MLRTPKRIELPDPVEAYAQNNTTGAYRIFFCYMKEESGGKKQAVISVIAITPHP